MARSSRFAAALLSLLLFAFFIAVWHVMTLPVSSGQAAETEYQQMKAATGKGWRWAALLNGTATASVVGGIVIAVQAYAPAIATSVNLGNSGLMMQVVSVGVGIAIAVWAAARAKVFGLSSLPTPFA